MDTKVCNACNKIFLKDMFVWGKCRICTNKVARERHAIRKIDPEYRARRNAIARKSEALNPRSYIKRRSEWLKYKYNMTLEDYDILLKSQNGVCAICLQECKTNKGLAVDHDHNCCPADKSCGKCTSFDSTLEIIDCPGLSETYYYHIDYKIGEDLVLVEF
jgi:hypothetical protein